jgi:hypothetical protein
MALGLIASIGINTTYTYTAPTNCKLLISSTCNAVNQGITLNSAYIYYNVGTVPTHAFFQTPLYVAANQIITIVTSNSGFCTISGYEE